MPDTAIDRALRFLTFAKSVDDGALKDLEQIPDITDDKTKLPSTAEVGGGGLAFAARGGQASPQIQAHGQMAPQTGLTQQYAEFADARMGQMEKSINALLGVVKGFVETLKAEPEEKKDEEVEKATVALRKGRVALRKAEDEDDEEDKKDEMEKADAHLKAAKALISKAFEGADDDEKEEKAEKAHASYKSLKASIAKAREAVVAKKAATEALAIVVEAAKAVETPVVVVEAVKGAEPDIAKAVESMNAAMVTQTKTMGDIMGMIAGQSRAGGATPPVFAKSTPSNSDFAAVADRIEAAADDGLLEGVELLKARGLLGRMSAVAAGHHDAAVFAAEVEKSTALVKGLFTQVAA